MNSSLVLRSLLPSDEAAFFAGLADWSEADRSWYTFDWSPGVTFAEHLERLRRNTAGIDLKPGYVASTMLYAFVGPRIVGRVSLRHQLTEALLRRGGHLGYAVGAPHRRQGYATEMIRQSFPFARSLGMSRLLVTCGDGNEPSWRAIERCGGQLEDKREDDEGQLIRRYWLAL